MKALRQRSLDLVRRMTRDSQEHASILREMEKLRAHEKLPRNPPT